MGRTTYTDEQRDNAVAMYQKHGTTHTADTLNIPKRTILTWAKDAGVIAHADQEKTAEARAVNAERVISVWGDYRESEALGAGSTAVALRKHLLDAAAETVQFDEDGKPFGGPSPQLIRAYAISYGVLVDKAELLSGNATQRIEHWAESELDREIESLIEKMEDRIMQEAQDKHDTESAEADE